MSEETSSNNEKPAKKLKTAGAGAVEAEAEPIVLRKYVQPHVMDKPDELQRQYANSKPYAHGVLKDAFDLDFLSNVQTEIKQNSKVNFKESDLFRVYQSIDMANLTPSEHGATFPHVLTLRNILYSKEWMSLMEHWCGLPPQTLTGKVDCAFNCHTTGCHLLCHDDVIGTRKISYILYLTDPESEWQTSEGGALELYDREIPNHDDNGKQGKAGSDATGEAQAKAMAVPLSIPSATLLPMFNQLAFFTVEPGVSFHSVQEVLGDRPRLSLQGWYHASEVPKHVEAATLQQLKTTRDNQEPAFSPIPYPQNDSSQNGKASAEAAAATTTTTSSPQVEFSEADREYLSKYLHETYLKDDALDNIRLRFEEDSSVQLRNFFCSSWVDKLNAARRKEDQATISVGTEGYYEQSVSKDWKLVGPAHKQRFLEFTNEAPKDKDKLDSMGSLLHHIKTKVLCSIPFQRFLARITSLGSPLGERGHIRRFRKGLDYTVAHYGILTKKSVLDATLCFVAGAGQELETGEDQESNDREEQEPNEDDVRWQSGDCGGFECYIEAEDFEQEGEGGGALSSSGGTEAAEEYNQDDDTELLSVSASNNTLSLVYRDPGTMRFVKYVGASAPGSRWDISMEYEVENESG